MFIYFAPTLFRALPDRVSAFERGSVAANRFLQAAGSEIEVVDRGFLLTLPNKCC